ncbi:MAG: hypothetical protein ACTSU9_00565 [Promethearchaeota archaeon]
MSEEERERLQPGGIDAPFDEFEEEFMSEIEIGTNRRGTTNETNRSRATAARIKEKLLVEEGVELLQALSQATIFLQANPEFDDELTPAINLARESSNPWIKQNAKKCLESIQSRKQGKTITTRDLSGKKVTPKDEYVNLLVKRGRETGNFRTKLEKVCGEQGIFVNEIDPPTDIELVRKIIESRTLKYLFHLFSKRNAIKIAHAVGVRITDECQDETKLVLKIHEKIGIKLDRSDYLEI